MSDSTTKSELAVVDISAYGLGITDAATVDPRVIHSLGNDICKSLTSVGICYITNHGIPQEQVDSLLKTSKTFFDLPTSSKEKYALIEGSYHGWIPFGSERTNRDRPVDYREAYAFTPSDDHPILPDEVPDFKASMETLFDNSKELSLRIIDLISCGLGLKDREFLRNCHTKIAQKGNCTTMRSTFYPPPREEQELLPEQIQCGEHTDFDTLTLLFQDDVGGLQVKSPRGDFIDAPPIGGTIMVIFGRAMQRWSADKIMATTHRVIIPKEKAHLSRQSIQLFVHADDDVMIRCLDGSDKYEPMTNKDFMRQSFKDIY